MLLPHPVPKLCRWNVLHAAATSCAASEFSEVSLSNGERQSPESSGAPSINSCLAVPIQQYNVYAVVGGGTGAAGRKHY